MSGEVATWAQLGLQDALSPVMEEFIFFHDFTMMILVFILTFVGSVMSGSFFSSRVNKGLLEGQAIECVWTLVPAVILIQIAIPSLVLLYMLDEATICGLTLKAIGHQWYWSYEYSDLWSKEESLLEFDSYMSSKEGSEEVRLLDVDNRTVLPHSAHVRVLVGSADVLHAWALPSLGVKIDACPGRLNQVKFIAHRPGVYYGQCSEVCGANHSFMPIVVEAISSRSFMEWALSLLNDE